MLLEKNEGHIAHTNPAAEKMLGYSKGESVGKRLQDIGVPLDMIDFSATMDALDRKGILNYENIPVKTRDGQVIHTDIYIVDKAQLAQCNIRDVTERKLADEKQKEEKKKLEAQLRQAQKMEAVGLLAGGIAHDFNNILNVIMGYGGMVLDRMESGSPSKKDMNTLLAAAERAANLTKRLLIFSKDQIVDVKPVNINELILELRKMLDRLIRESIELHLDLAAGSPLMVLADSGMMEQVLMNLVVNAGDAMPEGGQLSICTRLMEMDDQYVKMNGYGKPGRYALITVADTGQGIGAETQKRIFEPFFTTKGVGEGTGLGLAISYGIIQQHNGYINVYSDPPHGAVFNIYLPLREAKPSRDRQTTADVPVKGGSETILVAEDDPPLRELTRRMLEAFGYNVVSAKDGDDAITKFMENRERISLLLLDMIMPKKNGKEVAEATRKVNPRIKILFVSGYTLNVVKTRELIGADFNFINKPFQMKELVMKVRETLDK